MNELCFNNGKKKSPRQLIMLIISLVHYWTDMVKQNIKTSTALWLPTDLDVIPLASWHSDDELEDETVNIGNQIVPYAAQEN